MANPVDQPEAKGLGTKNKYWDLPHHAIDLTQIWVIVPACRTLSTPHQARLSWSHSEAWDIPLLPQRQTLLTMPYQRVQKTFGL